MLLILDEGVPSSVAQFFRSQDFVTAAVQEYLAPGTPDPVIATATDHLGAMLVSQDRDFKKIARRIPEGNRQRLRRMSRLSLTCKAPQAVNRLERYIDHIKVEISQAATRSDRRVFIEVGDRILRVIG